MKKNQINKREGLKQGRQWLWYCRSPTVIQIVRESLRQRNVSEMAIEDAATDLRDSHSRTPRNGKSTRILWNCPRVRAQSHATKRYLAVERPQVTRVERIGPLARVCEAKYCDRPQQH